MKKIILGLTIGLLLISCSSSSNDSASSSGVYKWSCKIDGVLYEWQGNHLTNQGAVIGAGGQSTYAVGSLALQIVNSATNGITVSAQMPNNATGNFVFNSSQPFNISITNGVPDPQNPQGIIYSTQFSGTMNVNIASISNDSFVTNPQNPGKVLGTFSGTIGKGSFSSGQITTSVVTDGSFEAVRAQ